MPAQGSSKTNRMVASVMILDWSVDPQEDNDVQTRSSIGSKHRCCSTHRPPIQSGCKVIHTQRMCNNPRRANGHAGYISGWVSGDIISFL